MKLLIMSDIHGDYEALSKVFEYYEKDHCDGILCLGDILYHGPRNDLPHGYAPKKCIPLLNAHKDEIIAVRGNCDAEVDQMVLDSPMRADYALYHIDGHTFFLTHGHLYNEQTMPHLKKGDVYLYGHFHVPVFEEADEGYYKVNPNSISLPKKGEAGFLEYEDGVFTRYNMNHDILETLKI